MLLHRAISQPEPQACALVPFGGVKRLKNVRQIFGAYAVASIGDGDAHPGTAVA
jgi:hypothetical protein